MGFRRIPKMTFAYLRISTNQAKQANSFLVQEKAITDQYKCDSIVKEAISGSAHLDKRKALLNMLEILKQGDKVIIYRMDRLSRDIIKAGWIKCEIEKKGAELISLETPKKDHTTELIENILLLIAQYEREIIRFRIQSALDSKKARGEALGGKYAPYGYDFEYKEGKKYIVKNDKEQEVIRFLKRFRTKNTNQILKILREKGILSKSGKRFNYRTLQKILQRIKEGFYD